MIQRLPWTKIFFIVVIVAAALPLLSYGYVGIFSRFKADDFSTAAILRDLGFWKAQLHWYTQWSGRFSFTFLVSLVQTTGRAYWLPFAILIAWGSATTWAISELLRYTKTAHRHLIAVASSLVLILCVLLATDRLGQSFYWLTGSLTYIAPLIFWMIFVAIIARAMHHSETKFPWPFLLLGFLLAFIAGGFSEAASAAQITLLILTILFVQIETRGRFRRKLQVLLLAGLMGSLLSLTVIAYAPGNAVRASYYPTRPKIVTVAKYAGIFTNYFLTDRFTFYLTPVLLSLFLALSLGLIQSRDKQDETVKRWRYQLIGLPLALLITVYACFVPSIFAVRIPLPQRAMIVPGFIFLGLLTVWGYVLGRTIGIILRRRSPARYYPGAIAVLISFTIITLLFAGATTLMDNSDALPGARQSALEFEKEEQMIAEQKAAGKEDIVIDHIKTNNPFDVGRYGSMGVTQDPQSDINKVMAQFYQVKSITGR
jgi:hypothetical protein